MKKILSKKFIDGITTAGKLCGLIGVLGFVLNLSEGKEIGTSFKWVQCLFQVWFVYCILAIISYYIDKQHAPRKKKNKIDKSKTNCKVNNIIHLDDNSVKEYAYNEILECGFKKCGIYCIKNTITHECYIGQAIDIARRWKQHIGGCEKGEKKVLYDAMREYGMRNFKFFIVEECPPTILDLKEYDYIQLYDSHKRGYNSNSGNKNKAEAVRAYLSTAS